MAKKRLYVPLDDEQLKFIEALAKLKDRSNAYIASQLITDGMNFNLLYANPIKTTK